jgi:SAM-dependent methyltransferase
MASTEVLSEQYTRRSQASQVYRDGVWKVILQSRLQAWVGRDKDVLDLGCGWGEFIRNVSAAEKYAMDLNPDAAAHTGENVKFMQQDCASHWELADNCLDVVFSSNFIEHLPDKAAVEATLDEAHRCLRPGGKIIFLGPNIRYTGGAYWDFWDHHIAITDRSLKELLELRGYAVNHCIPRFLPYTMSEGRQAPLWMVRAFLALPIAWPLLGKQFLVMGQAR